MFKFLVFIFVFSFGFGSVGFGARNKSLECGPALSENSFDYFKRFIPRNGKSKNLNPGELKVIFGLRDRAQEGLGQMTRIQNESEAKLILEITGKSREVGSAIYLEQIQDKILLQAFAGLAYQFAAERMTAHLPIDDLVQVAMIGLVHAIRSYPADSEYMFSSVATNHMKTQYAMLKRKEQSGFTVLKSNVFVFEEIMAIRERYTFELGRPPEVREIVSEYNSKPDRKTKVTEDQVKDILTKAAWRNAAVSLVKLWNDRASLAEERVGNFEVDAVALVPGKGPEGFQQLVLKELRREVAEVLMTLSPRERFVIAHRFGISVSREESGGFIVGEGEEKVVDVEEKTLQEIGQMMEITRERVRQIEAKALRRLRDLANSDQLKVFVDDSHVPRRTGPWAPRMDLPEDDFSMQLREGMLQAVGGLLD